MFRQTLFAISFITAYAHTIKAAAYFFRLKAQGFLLGIQDFEHLARDFFSAPAGDFSYGIPISILKSKPH